MPRHDPDPERPATTEAGVPRRVTGRRVRIPLSLVFSSFHRPLDVALYGYVQALGGHNRAKIPGIGHLADMFAVSASTVQRAIARLAAPAGPHPAYLARTRAGRRREQTTLTLVTPPEDVVFVDVPYALLHDVVHRLLDPVDLRVWCALHDRADATGALTRSPLW